MTAREEKRKCGGYSDLEPKTTILYISCKTENSFGVILHTFMSSMMCGRLQCFLAEYVLADEGETLTEEWGLPKRFQEGMDLLSQEVKMAYLGRLECESSLGAPILLAKLRRYYENQESL